MRLNSIEFRLQWCWWQRYVTDLMMIICWWSLQFKESISIILVTNINRRQHPSLTSILVWFQLIMTNSQQSDIFNILLFLAIMVQLPLCMDGNFVWRTCIGMYLPSNVFRFEDFEWFKWKESKFRKIQRILLNQHYRACFLFILTSATLVSRFDLLNSPAVSTNPKHIIQKEIFLDFIL